MTFPSSCRYMQSGLWQTRPRRNEWQYLVVPKSALYTRTPHVNLAHGYVHTHPRPHGYVPYELPVNHGPIHTLHRDCSVFCATEGDICRARGMSTAARAAVGSHLDNAAVLPEILGATKSLKTYARVRPLSLSHTHLPRVSKCWVGGQRRKRGCAGSHAATPSGAAWRQTAVDLDDPGPALGGRRASWRRVPQPSFALHGQ
jgi:hypothetical protein